MVGIADGWHRPAGSPGCRNLVLVSQQAPPLFIVRHIRLFGICGEEKLTAADEYVDRSHDLGGMSRGVELIDLRWWATAYVPYVRTAYVH